MFVTTFYPKTKRDLEGIPEKDWPMMNTIYHHMQHGKEELRLVDALKPISYWRVTNADGTVTFTMEL